MSSKKSYILQTEKFVKDKLESQGAGHDFAHIERVRKMALKIAKKEKADIFIVELASLLHDVADRKFHNGDLELGPRLTREHLVSLKLEPEVIEQVVFVVENQSFHKSFEVDKKIFTKELMCVQDADRLEAIGAIGIARAFAYGGWKGRPLHDPKAKPIKHKSFETYKIKTASTINHFYEKLLLLKDMMNTKTGKKIAQQRHSFMEKFLKEFLAEWQGKK